ncbi:AAA family ATPase [Chloroflexota bacterium]
MAVVTIRGQSGSGAPKIGRLVADKLNANYVDREIIAKVAKLLNRQQQDVISKEMPPGSFLGRIAEILARGATLGSGYPGVYLRTWEIPLDNTRYLEGLQSIIMDVAGNLPIVIRGRGSQFILKDHPGTLHVLIIAPLEIRVERVMKSQKVDEAAAQKQIAHFDSSRKEFIKRYFQADMGDLDHYDLVINTKKLSFEAAASIVTSALPARKQTKGRRVKSG